MNLRDHFRLMSGWHVWTFERLYAVVDGLDDADYRKDAGLFFKSVHGSLNHMLLVEHNWAGRLSGDLFKAESLAQEIEPDRARLRERLLAHAAIWGRMVDTMSEADLGEKITYRAMAGTEHTLSRGTVIHTLFTHGSHHRGQITTVLTQMGKEAPVMDYPYYILSLPNA
jgi:uncharacterized damage-inducible protein DinB